MITRKLRELLNWKLLDCTTPLAHKIKQSMRLIRRSELS